MVEPLSDMAFAELRLRDLAETPPEVLDHHFEAWFASRLEASGVNLPVDFVSSLKKAAKAALLTADVVNLLAGAKRKPKGVSQILAHPWIDVDAPFEGSGEYSCRVIVATTWLGLECELQDSHFDGTFPHARDKRLIKVRRPVVDQNTPVGDVRVFNTKLCRTYVEESKGSRGYKPSRWGPRNIGQCDACGVENYVPGVRFTQEILVSGVSNEMFCDECLESGACPDDPDYGYTWEHYPDYPDYGYEWGPYNL
jgi:hypothetical protein